MVGALQRAQQQGTDWQIEVEFFAAVLAILDGQTPELPEDQPYAPELVNAIQRACHRVHFTLGPGFLHQVYRRYRHNLTEMRNVIEKIISFKKR